VVWLLCNIFCLCCFILKLFMFTSTYKNPSFIPIFCLLVSSSIGIWCMHTSPMSVLEIQSHTLRARKNISFEKERIAGSECEIAVCYFGLKKIHLVSAPKQNNTAIKTERRDTTCKKYSFDVDWVHVIKHINIMLSTTWLPTS